MDGSDSVIDVGDVVDMVDVGDVLVVGAGIAGLMTAAALRRAGVDVTVIDRTGVAAEQSNHAHGYLHRGYIYLDAAPNVVHELNGAAAAWDVLRRHYAMRPVVSDSTMAFTNPAVARHAMTRWEELGLPVEAAPVPSRFRRDRVVSAFRTDEPTFDLSPFYRAFIDDALRDVDLRLGTARSIVPGQRRANHLVADVPSLGGRVGLRAEHYVLAAGFHNPATIGRRMSYMLCVWGRDLPLIGVAFPEIESRGLFVASRFDPSRQSTLWMVSDFVSFAPQQREVASVSRWAGVTLAALRKLTDVTAEEVQGVGVYAAPKGEGRRDARRPDTFVVDHPANLANVTALWPAKLTLAPVAAQGAADRVLAAISARRGAHPRATPPVRELGVQPERWTSVIPQPWPADDRIDLDDVIDLDRAVGRRVKAARAARSVAGQETGDPVVAG